MSKRSTHHATFVIERNYDAAPVQVFVAWAQPKAKARWFVGPDEWEKSDHQLDFRVGGRERPPARIVATNCASERASSSLTRPCGPPSPGGRGKIGAACGRRFMGSVSGGPPGGATHIYNAVYQDIVPNERIVYSYDMHLDKTRISVSLATVEFKPAGAGTRMIFTEQDVFLDGIDSVAAGEQGTRDLLDNLSAYLRGK